MTSRRIYSGTSLQASFVTVGALLLMFAVMSLVMFRDCIFRKK